MGLQEFAPSGGGTNGGIDSGSSTNNYFLIVSMKHD